MFEETKVAEVPACNVPGTCTITATNPTSITAIANTLAIYPTPTSLIGGGARIQAPNLRKPDQTTRRLRAGPDRLQLLGKRIRCSSGIMRTMLFILNRTAAPPLRSAAAHCRTGMSRMVLLRPVSKPPWKERHILSPDPGERRAHEFPPRPTKNSNETSALRPRMEPIRCNSSAAPGLEDGFINITSIPGGLGGAAAEIFFSTKTGFTWADDILWTRGSHTIRFGASVARQQSNTWNAIGEDAQWTFTGGLASFLAGAATQVTGVPPSPANNANRDYRETDFTPYIQDDWKVSPKLTVNLGLRVGVLHRPDRGIRLDTAICTRSPILRHLRQKQKFLRRSRRIYLLTIGTRVSGSPSIRSPITRPRFAPVSACSTIPLLGWHIKPGTEGLRRGKPRRRSFRRPIHLRTSVQRLRRRPLVGTIARTIPRLTLFSTTSISSGNCSRTPSLRSAMSVRREFTC